MVMQEVAVPITNRPGPAPTHARKDPAEVNVGDTERLVSVLGAGLLAAYGLRHMPLGLGLVLLGGALAYRGVSGHCAVYQALGVNTSATDSGVVQTEKAWTINKPADELYRFWRDFTNLPQFMKHLEAVTVLDERRSHWVARAPVGMTVEWDAEIVDERPNELIAWRSLPGAQVENSGSVRFVPAPGNHGTEVRVRLEYKPPAGAVGVAIAKLLREEPTQQVEGDVRRFKQLMEAGELPTNEGQPAGGKRAKQ